MNFNDLVTFTLDRLRRDVFISLQKRQKECCSRFVIYSAQNFLWAVMNCAASRDYQQSARCLVLFTANIHFKVSVNHQNILIIWLYQAGAICLAAQSGVLHIYHF